MDELDARSCTRRRPRAAIVGQLAGAHYGVDGIPPHWLVRLKMREDIDALARALHAR